MTRCKINSKLVYSMIVLFLIYCSYTVTNSIHSCLIYSIIGISYILLSSFLSNRNMIKEAGEYVSLQVIITLIYWMIIGRTFVDDMSFNGILFFTIIMIMPYVSKLNCEKKHE
ncbi:hypothetical protein [Clostridium sp. JNZ J1-5]|nr:hypothetical protein [Clostridium sp.]